MSTEIYWIRTKGHSDIMSEGYIGVSNNTEKRFAKHRAQANQMTHINPKFANAVKKYGWDNIVFSIVSIGVNKYCLELETKLRPEKEIGWNIAPGGGMPSIKFGKENPMCNPEVAAKTAATKKGIATRGYGWKHSEETCKKIAKAATGRSKLGKQVVIGDLEFISQAAAAKHFNTSVRTLKRKLASGVSL